jgi:hypothetical protein
MAIDFESGSSQYVVMEDSASLSTGDIDFAIAAWVNVETFDIGRIACKRNADNVIEWELTNGAAGAFAFIIYNSTGATLNSTAYGGSALSLGVWYHIVGWHDAAANTVNICVNGGTVYSAATTIAPSDSVAKFRIGARHTTPELFYDGLVEDVRFYKRVLTAEERSALAAGYRGPLGGEQGWWTLQDAQVVQHWDGDSLATTDVIPDMSGNGNDGTPTNTPTARASEAPRFGAMLG